MTTTSALVPAVSRDSDANTGIGASFVNSVAGNFISYLAAAAALTVGSMFLTGAQYGYYTAAYGVAQMIILLADGGLKSALLRGRFAYDRETATAIASITLRWSLMMACCGAIVCFAAVWVQLMDLTVAFYITAFMAIAGVSQCILVPATIVLEDQLQFPRIARLEAIGNLSERLSPLGLAVLFPSHFFVATALGYAAGRIVRSVALNQATDWRYLALPTTGANALMTRHVSVGRNFNVATIAALVRDNLGSLVVAPIFGAAALGQLNWALHLGSVSSQMFAQVLARLLYPRYGRAENKAQLLEVARTQVSLTLVGGGAALAAVVIAASSLNVYAFHAKWTIGVGIFAFLAWRFVLGLILTPLSTLAFAKGDPRQAMIVSSSWCLLELFLLLLLMPMYGLLGISISYMLGPIIILPWYLRMTAGICGWKASIRLYTYRDLLADLAFMTVMVVIGCHMDALWGRIVVVCALVIYAGTRMAVKISKL